MSSNLLEHLQKTYKTNVFNHKSLPALQMVSTGIATLDLALGGGLAVGRVAELFGPESAGKSTICLSICRTAINRGETALYIDLEKTVTKEAIADHGLDNDHFIVTRPNYGEDAIDQLIDAVKLGAKVVILDTVAMLMPKAVYDKIDSDSEARDVSSTAGFLNRVKNKITDQVEHNQAVVVFVNQVRDNLNSSYGGVSTPGGHAIKHLYSQRIKVSHAVKDLKTPGRISAQVKIEKNKCATPYLSCEVPIFNGVAQIEECLVLVGVQLGLVKQSGAWYNLEPLSEGAELVKLQGSINAAKYLKENPDYADLLYARITQQINEART
jgi:recombination protein RecA